MTIKSNKSRNIILNIIFIIASIAMILSIIYTAHFPAITSYIMTFIFSCAWACYYYYWYKRVYRNKFEDFDFVYDSFKDKDLIAMMEKEEFRQVNKLVEVSDHWLRFANKYVPINFVMGFYIEKDSNANTVLNLALITGESIKAIVSNSEYFETISFLEGLMESRKDIDVEFKNYWLKNKLTIRADYKNSLKYFNYVELVYKSNN